MSRTDQQDDAPNGPAPTGTEGDAAQAAAWFFETSDDIFVVVRAGIVLRANPAWSRLTGWGPDEIVGRSFKTPVHPDDLELVRRTAASMAPGDTVSYEHRLVTKAGAELWVHSRVKLTETGEALVTLRDITSQRRNAQHMQRSKHMSDLLRGTSGVSVWVFDPQINCYDLDPSTAGTRTPEEDVHYQVPAALLQDAIHPDDRDAVDAIWQRALATGADDVVEYRSQIPFQEGMRRLRSAWIGSHMAANGQWIIHGLTQDITDLVEARDAALAASRTKTQFLANMSHELRTPMNGVLGVLHLLKANPYAPDAASLIKDALAAGQGLSQLLSDTVDFAQLEDGRIELSPAPTDVAETLDSVVRLLREEAQERGLWLTTDIAPDVGWVDIDTARLRQVVFQLLANALKFTLKGGVDVRVRASGAPTARRLRIEVADTGVGIRQEDQDSVFDRFIQADGSTTRRFGGIGIGLPIARRLAQLMDGDVGFESREGQGSTFWIEISAPACAAPGSSPLTEGEGWLSGLTVLVVEDNATNRLVATKMLAQLGADVVVAEDGAQGYEAAALQVFDLIFMDIQMPVMDGIAATKAIRALPAPFGSAPIVATTANVLAHQIKAYRDSGMNGCVAKPISPAALLNELARLANDEGLASEPEVLSA
ncbi:MAG: ATP-binding protein [Caulobacteraceae bacterium]